jgi:hypothetical protein
MGQFEIGGVEDLPFGKPFNYTEDIPLLSEKRPWYHWLLRKKRNPPAAWITQDVDQEDGPGHREGQAYVVLDGKELRVTPIEPDLIIPVPNKDLAESIAVFYAAVADEIENPKECHG